MKRLLAFIFVFAAIGLTQAFGQGAASGSLNSPAASRPVVVPPAKVAKSLPPASGEDKNHPTKTATAAPIPAAAAKPVLPPTETYRVGPGDVLDIRLLNFSARQSSLFTVSADGKVAYSYLSAPLQVAGLTTDEIAGRLNSLIKVFDQPQAVVTVRHYASHSVTVSGLAGKTGPQTLQREAIPLYVLLTLAQPLPEAAQVVIIRAGQSPQEFKLANVDSLNALVLPGDEVKLLPPPPPPPAPKEFFYIIGTINQPGQKAFHQGLTLTQAIFAAGGLTKNNEVKVRLLRQNANGLLATTEYSLKHISQGKMPDPLLQSGDRLEVLGKD